MLSLVHLIPNLNVKKLLLFIGIFIILIFLFKITKKFKYQPIGKAKYSHTNDNWRELPSPTIKYRPYYNPSNKQIYRFPQIQWLSNNKI